MIPAMTHELGQYWDQPNHDDILVDDLHALMTLKTFEKLHSYDYSRPTGVYEGKMWKRNELGVDYLVWYGPAVNAHECSVNFRKIIVVI